MHLTVIKTHSLDCINKSVVIAVYFAVVLLSATAVYQLRHYFLHTLIWFVGCRRCLFRVLEVVLW